MILDEKGAGDPIYYIGSDFSSSIWFSSSISVLVLLLTRYAGTDSYKQMSSSSFPFSELSLEL
jgi:hypothetical protein